MSSAAVRHIEGKHKHYTTALAWTFVNNEEGLVRYTRIFSSLGVWHHLFDS